MELPWWLIAVFLTLLGTSFSAFGLCLQKYSHAKQQETDSGDEGQTRQASQCSCPNYCFRWWWMLGMGVFLAGHVLCWFALALGTQSVLSCINCWSMVVTFVIAPSLLGETVSIFRMFSVVLLIVGCIWVIIYGPRRYQEYTVERLIDGWRNFTMQVITLFVGCVVLFFLARASITRRRPRISTFQATLIAAMLGWYSVLCAKCTAGLFFTSVHHGDNQYNHASSWILVLVTVVLAVSNIHCMNVALEHGDAVQVVPLYEALSIMGQITIGGIFFKEFSYMTLSQHLNFWAGASCVILGVFCVSSAGPQFLQKPFLSPATTPGTITPVLGATPTGGTTPREGHTPVTGTSPRVFEEKLLFRREEVRNYQATSSQV